MTNASWQLHTIPVQILDNTGHGTTGVNSGTVLAIPGRLATLKGREEEEGGQGSGRPLRLRIPSSIFYPVRRCLGYNSELIVKTSILSIIFI